MGCNNATHNRHGGKISKERTFHRFPLFLLLFIYIREAASTGHRWSLPAEFARGPAAPGGLDDRSRRIIFHVFGLYFTYYHIYTLPISRLSVIYSIYYVLAHVLFLNTTTPVTCTPPLQ